MDYQPNSQTRDIEGLFKQLENSKSDDERYVAAQALGTLPFGQVAPRLINTLKNHTDHRARLGAVRALTAFNKIPEVNDALAEALVIEQDIEVRRDIISAFGAPVDQRVVDLLVKVLKEDSAVEVRSSAVYVLRNGKNPPIDLFIQMLRDNTQEVVIHYSILHSLGYMRSSAAIEPIVEILRNTDDKYKRQNAVEALGMINDRATKVKL